MDCYGHTLVSLATAPPPPKRSRLPTPTRGKADQVREVRVCTNRTCRRQGSFQTLETLSSLAPPNVAVRPCGCLGRCGSGPNLVLLPDGFIVGHCGTAARSAEIMASLFAGGDNYGQDPTKNSLDALALRKRADIEFEKRNFVEAELLLSQVGRYTLPFLFFFQKLERLIVSWNNCCRL